MTTTSSRKRASSVTVIIGGISEALNVKVLYPIQLTSTMASGPDTERTKSPSSPVDVPVVVPCSMRVTPMTGPRASCTTPFTSYPPWADTDGAAMHRSIDAARKDKILFIGFYVLYSFNKNFYSDMRISESSATREASLGVISPYSGLQKRPRRQPAA